ncbi:lethal (3) malignant brain tumor isoform X1 [Rhynchophorus ferrugineus]|uniref:lethal (3) malignant brain tumor isoform X1 n=2 Tax=Rhynchophorus ferrugineus TaxID=354439 RepID=UPI003FCD9B9A
MIDMASSSNEEGKAKQADATTKIQIGSSAKIVIENNSDDITISKCEQNCVNQDVAGNTSQNSVALKTKVLPLVYQVPFGSVNFNKASNNNFIFTPITTGYMNKTAPSKNVIITPGRSSLVLPKQPLAIVPAGAKVPPTYLTMLKKVPKPTEFQTDGCKITEGLVVSQNGFASAGAASQKILLTPMPKIQSNRPPVTVTTNSVHPKIAVLPMPVPQNDSKIYNFQISDGKIQYSGFNNPLTIMRESKTKQNSSEDQVEIIPEKSLVCNESLEVSPEKNDISNKTYELSIAEESLSNQSDCRLVVSSVDSNSSSENMNNSNSNKQPLKFSHGVSILKKNFINNIFPESKKTEPLVPSTASKEKDLAGVKPVNGMEDSIVVAVPSIPAASKPEKSRRKSQFSFRKDFDDMEISFIDADVEPKVEESKPPIETKTEKTTKSSDGDQEMDPKNIFNFSESDVDAAKLLEWDDGIGVLPGSSLKFIMNEFGIIEYLQDEDYQKIQEKKVKKAKEKEDMEREVHCLECGCYGILSDFISSSFCSMTCQEACLNITRKPPDISGGKKGAKRKFCKSKSDNDIKEESGDEDDVSNDMPTDKFSYPWACKKKGFSWSKYLTHVNAKAAPLKLFKDPFPYTRNCFKAGMKLEGVDPQHPSYFCVLTVVDAVGYRIRLHFDGYSDNYDFWANADSMDVFPMGWCEKYGHVLHPPPGYTEENFNWVQYLRVTKSTAAPKHLFANRAGQAICPNGFRIGMKLEAVDKKNTSLVCVATVRDMMDNRLLVHFDGWDDIYDYWADPTSPYIHPVGWCDQYGHNLTPPSDYPTPETFTWEKYLKEKKAVAAPVRAFKQRSACGFKRGMRLECVDKRVPHLIRVATVDDVKEHQIRIHFDGWPDRYSYWVDDDSPDIHPVGWCQKTGHPMEPPLTPDDVYDFLECPTVGCRGEGHTLGLKYTTHSVQKYCPYAEVNIDADKILPDRLLSPDRSPEAKIPVSREPKDYKLKPRVGRPPKWLKELEASKIEIVQEPPEKRPKRSKNSTPVKSKKDKADDTDDNKDNDQELLMAKAQKLIEDSQVLPAEKESWRRHSTFLGEYVSTGDNPWDWTPGDVAEFVAGIPGCDTKTDLFIENDIDGESLLHLSQCDILQLLHLKVGPAVKLYSSVVLLRHRFSDRNAKNQL